MLLHAELILQRVVKGKKEGREDDERQDDIVEVLVQNYLMA